MSKILIITVVSTTTLTNISAFTSNTLDSDYIYEIEATDEPEFYKSGSTKYNYKGNMPSYMREIYGINNNTIHNSQFGSNIIDLNGYGYYNGNTYGYGYGFDYKNFVHSIDNDLFDKNVGGGYSYNVNTGATENVDNNVDVSNNNNQDNVIIWNGNNNNNNNNQVVNGLLPNEKGEITFPSYFLDNNYYNDYYTDYNDDVVLGSYYNDAIGKIKINDVDLQVYAYDYDDIYSSMRKGVGHMEGTAYWNGNVVFFGHNRGNYGFFNKLKKVDKGDSVYYYTNEGRRKYEVDKVVLVEETDWSLLNYTRSNKITLITCVEDVPELRLVVQATETE